jgi:hypothetical protein
MLPSSHFVSIVNPSVEPLPSPLLRAGAFSEFIAASSLQESSYRGLQQKPKRNSKVIDSSAEEVTRMHFSHHQ